jgi:hypothetical protein
MNRTRVTIDPKSAYAHFALGFAYFIKGGKAAYRSAKVEFERALSSDGVGSRNEEFDSRTTGNNSQDNQVVWRWSENLRGLFLAVLCYGNQDSSARCPSFSSLWLRHESNRSIQEDFIFATGRVVCSWLRWFRSNVLALSAISPEAVGIHMHS